MRNNDSNTNRVALLPLLETRMGEQTGLMHVKRSPGEAASNDHNAPKRPRKTRQEMERLIANAVRAETILRAIERSGFGRRRVA